MPAIVQLSPSGDTSGATDRAAINKAFRPGDQDISVQLGPGHWFTDQPLTPGNGNELAGVKGGVNGGTSTGPAGTVIHPAPRFSGSGVIDLADGTHGCRVRDLSILNDLGTGPGVDGISCHRVVNGSQFQNLSIALVTGHGIAFHQGGDGKDGDGLKMRTVMIQKVGQNGVHRPVNDANIHDVHVQYAGQAGGTYRHGFYSTPGNSGNMSYIGCRADLCRGAGWVIDHQGTFGDATKLSGCSTERNEGDGVLIDNTSATGSDWRDPVVIDGCCFEGDGTGGGDGGDYAAIRVRGRNRVHISGTITAVNVADIAAGAPKYALYLQQAGSDSAVAEVVEWASGRLNYSTGQKGEALHNHSLADRLVFGPSVTQTPGYERGTDYTRSGQATLVNGQVTVTSPWVWPASQIIVSTLVPVNSDRVWVDSRSDAAFVIKSANRADGSTVAWLLTQL